MKQATVYQYDDFDSESSDRLAPTLADAQHAAKVRCEEYREQVEVYRVRVAGTDIRRMICNVYNRQQFRLSTEIVGHYEWDESEVFGRAVWFPATEEE